MELTKTSAIVCKKTDARNGMRYEALLFITDTPYSISDEDLKQKINLSAFKINSDCNEILYRADVHATSNEVQEQFEKLHTLEKHVPIISFGAL